jgi:hypothetical protein
MEDRFIRINPDGTISLHLNNQERTLLLEETAVDILGSAGLVQKIRFAVVENEKVICNVTFDELDELAGFLAIAANHAEEEKLQNKLYLLADQIEAILERLCVKEPPEGPQTATDSEHSSLQLSDFLQGRPEDMEFSDIEDANAFLSFMLESYKQTPQPELGNLSPSQLQELLMSDWANERGAISLDSNLSLAELKEVRIFQNARTLLSAVHNSDGVKTTTRGNLNRAFLKEMLGAMDWPAGYAEDVLKCFKAFNEYDMPELHILRLILGKEGLLRSAKGILKITKKGREMLQDERAGELYSLLFKANFQKLNLAYMSFGPELPELQHTIAFSFYMLSKHVNKWTRLETLAPFLLLPSAKEPLEGVGGSYAAIHFKMIVLHRIIQPLESFGLLEIKESKGKKFLQNHMIRKTALFDRFIRFNLVAHS